MKCATAPECEWMERFGIRTCRRLFSWGRCKPIDEGSEDIEKMPMQPDRDMPDEELE